jgi:SAM-dependent methyltransferase
MRGTTEQRKSAVELPYDAQAYWTSYYKAQSRGPAGDWITVGAGTEVESRFHYNSTENSIIRALLRREPVAGMTAAVWRFAQERRGRRLLDIGSGTGHWIDFFRQVFRVAGVVGVELAPQMADRLREKYAGDAAVAIRALDVSETRFDLSGERFDLISAIGVMFHIIDDDRWRRAIGNLAGVLAPGGVMIVGGDFGTETRNVQFHASDHFESWNEQTASTAEMNRVNKRVRSLADWHAATAHHGLTIADLIRSDREPGIATPENDILVLSRTP